MAILDRMPHVLFYAAMLGLVILLAEHVIGKVKAPAKRTMNLG